MQEEEMLATDHPKLRMAYHQPFEAGDLRELLAELDALVDQDDEVIRGRLAELAIDYNPCGLAMDTDLFETARSDGPHLTTNGPVNDKATKLVKT